MKNVFLDTNILIDFFSAREPFADSALKIFSDGFANKIKIYVSSHTILTSHYILKRNIYEPNLLQLISNILNFIIIIPVDADILKKALNSNYKDFEDAVQIHSAYKIDNIEYIITRDKKGFRGCEIPVITPDQY